MSSTGRAVAGGETEERGGKTAGLRSHLYRTLSTLGVQVAPTEGSNTAELRMGADSPMSADEETSFKTAAIKRALY